MAVKKKCDVHSGSKLHAQFFCLFKSLKFNSPIFQSFDEVMNFLQSASMMESLILERLSATKSYYTHGRHKIDHDCTKFVSMIVFNKFSITNFEVNKPLPTRP